MYLSHDAPCRAARLMFILLMSLAFAGAPQWASVRAARADAAPLPPPTLTTVADRFDKLMDAIAEQEQNSPRDTFDLAAVLKTTGNDPKEIFHWVRDHTNWIPYRGELRGSVGVLMDRMGNSLDRSILLAELLRKAGVTVRLAHAKLEPQVAQGALSHVRTEPAPGSIVPPSVFPPSNLDQILAGYASKLAMPAEALRGAVDNSQAHAQRLDEQCIARTSDQLQTLTELLAPTASAATQPAAEETLTIFANHFWVQQETEKDKWLDLDPMLPDAEPGHSIASAQQAIPLPPDNKPVFLPDSFHQLVAIRVFVEQIVGKKRQTKQVVSTVIRPADVIGQRISIANVPMQWPHDNSLFTADKPTDALKKLASSQRSYVPVLTIGDRSIHAGSFDVNGNVEQNADLTGLGDVGKSAVSAAKKAVDVFNGLDKQNDKPLAAETTGALVSEWLEYEVQIPGRDARKFRRDVFVQDGFQPGGTADSEPQLTPAQQVDRGLALLSSVDVLLAPCQLSDAFASHVMAANLLASRGVSTGLLRDPDLLHRKTLSDDLSKLATMPAKLLEWATLRHHLNRNANETCIESPTLATYVTIPTLDESGKPGTLTGFDLIDVPIALRPASKADPFHAALEQGVLDTNIEAYLVASDGHVLNTAEMMSMSDTQGVDWVVVEKSGDPKLAASGLSAQAQSRIADDLAAGDRVVIPAKPIHVGTKVASGWWRVNPHTGQTLGMMETGRGAAIPEYAYVLAAVLSLTMAGITYAGCMGDGGSTAKAVACIGCAVMAAILMAVTVFAIWAAPPVAYGIAFAVFTPASGGLCYAVSKMQ